MKKCAFGNELGVGKLRPPAAAAVESRSLTGQLPAQVACRNLSPPGMASTVVFTPQKLPNHMAASSRSPAKANQTLRYRYTFSTPQHPHHDRVKILLKTTLHQGATPWPAFAPGHKLQAEVTLDLIEKEEVRKVSAYVWCVTDTYAGKRVGSGTYLPKEPPSPSLHSSASSSSISSESPSLKSSTSSHSIDHPHRKFDDPRIPDRHESFALKVRCRCFERKDAEEGFKRTVKLPDGAELWDGEGKLPKGKMRFNMEVDLADFKGFDGQLCPAGWDPDNHPLPPMFDHVSQRVFYSFVVVITKGADSHGLASRESFSVPILYFPLRSLPSIHSPLTERSTINLPDPRTNDPFSSETSEWIVSTQRQAIKGNLKLLEKGEVTIKLALPFVHTLHSLAGEFTTKPVLPVGKLIRLAISLTTAEGHEGMKVKPDKIWLERSVHFSVGKGVRNSREERVDAQDAISGGLGASGGQTSLIHSSKHKWQKMKGWEGGAGAGEPSGGNLKAANGTVMTFAGASKPKEKHAERRWSGQLEIGRDVEQTFSTPHLDCSHFIAISIDVPGLGNDIIVKFPVLLAMIEVPSDKEMQRLMQNYHLVARQYKKGKGDKHMVARY